MKKLIIILFSFLSLDFLAQEKAMDSPEQMPEFVGGAEKMMEFIRTNLKLPDSIFKDSTFNGCKNIIKFVVDANGKVINEAIARECIKCPDCDKEAIRVIAAMPEWKPGQNAGKAVAVNMALPIFFSKPLKNAK